MIEAKWSGAWERDRCYRAPDLPHGKKFFNYDSGPFTDGPLHLGHVRTHVLGDVTARYQRARGRCVLYCTEWDAFGLPSELEAARRGESPPAFSARWIAKMSRQMRALGISYDWSRVRATCDPRYMRLTQWLFLRLLEAGLVARREAELPCCPSCDTVLSRLQIDDGTCSRCGAPVEQRRLDQWFVCTSRSNAELLRSLDALGGFSPQVRNLLRGHLHGLAGRVGEGDWPVSRQRSWGTPIPVVHCAACGILPVPDDELPVCLPDDLDWSIGAAALARHPGFVETRCPGCADAARRETDTLDCFFDDLGCFVSCLVDPDGPPRVDGAAVSAWMPVDRFHGGLDTVAYLHLHRFLARALRQAGAWSIDEPIAGHVGHEMVLFQGRKMSKDLGNAVSPSALVRRHGADALRVAVLWAAAPHSAIDWRPGLVDRAVDLLDRVWRNHGWFAEHGESRFAAEGGAPSRAVDVLRRSTARAVEAIGRFVDENRPNAAIEELAGLTRLTSRFVRSRRAGERLGAPDRLALRGILEAQVVALAPFAPHLAEELWHRLGHGSYVVREPWPSPSLREDALLNS